MSPLNKIHQKIKELPFLFHSIIQTLFEMSYNIAKGYIFNKRLNLSHKDHVIIITLLIILKVKTYIIFIEFHYLITILLIILKVKILHYIYRVSLFDHQNFLFIKNFYVLRISLK